MSDQEEIQNEIEGTKPAKKKRGRPAKPKLYVNCYKGNIHTAQGKLKPGEEGPLTPAEIEGFGDKVKPA